jgi:uncharacterized membrane protein YqaE (UPF0057 family)
MSRRARRPEYLPQRLSDSIWFWNLTLAVLLPFIPLTVWLCADVGLMARHLLVNIV